MYESDGSIMVYWHALDCPETPTGKCSIHQLINFSHMQTITFLPFEIMRIKPNCPLFCILTFNFIIDILWAECCFYFQIRISNCLFSRNIVHSKWF